MRRPLLLVLLLALAAGQACTPEPLAEPGPERRAPLGEARDRYGSLPDRGETAVAGRGVLDLERGYYRGDLHLTGSGIEKRGAGVGESVIDGNVLIDGDGWVLSAMTIRGDVVIRGDDNDVSGCKVQGKVRIERGQRNQRRAGR